MAIDLFEFFSADWTLPIVSVAGFIVATAWVLLGSDNGNSSKPRAVHPPGSFGMPVLGDTINITTASRKDDGLRHWFVEKVAKYGPVFKTKLLGSPLVCVCNPAANKFLFQNEGKSVELCWPGPNARLLGPNSFPMKVGEPYRIARRHFAHFLEHSSVMQYLGRFDALAAEHFARHWDGKSELVALEVTKLYTFATISTFLMSLSDGPEFDDLYKKFRVWSRGHVALPLNLPGFTYHTALKTKDQILEILGKYISQRKLELAKVGASDEGKVDMLTSLLTTPDEDGVYMSEEAIKDNIMMFLFAGLDTGSVTLSMTLRFLGKNPHVLKQLQEEHAELLKRKRENGETTALTRDDLSAMKFSWAVLQESLRLQPPIAGNQRLAIADIELDGYSIPKGWKLMWTNQICHFDPDLFENPHSFDPSRWEKPPPPSSFLPFGGGVRRCPGSETAKMQMLVFLHHLVQRYTWTLLAPDEIIYRDPLLRTPNGVPIRIERIESQA